MSLTVTDLLWLAGTWAGVDSDATEHWLAPRGGAMAGVNHSTRDGHTTSVEFMLISERPDGLLAVDIVLPRTDRRLHMTMLETGSEHFRFGDPSDDTHHVSYTGRDGHSLTVTVTNGDRTFDAHFQRVR